MRLRKDRFILSCLKPSWFQTNPNYDRGVRLVRVEKIDGFHSDVIKLLSQNSEVLLVLLSFFFVGVYVGVCVCVMY